MKEKDNRYILETCKKCGNKGLFKKVGSYKQEWTDYDEREPVFNAEATWTMLECPVCSEISLHKSYTNDTMMNAIDEALYYENTIVYPEKKYSFDDVPRDILESYEAAVKTSKVDLNVSLIAIRMVLEKICKERGTKKKNLDAMLKEMVSKNILPDTLDKCSFLIRKLGNSGAHGDNTDDLNALDVMSLIDFIETIMYYIYELPVKIGRLNSKYNLEEKIAESCDAE